MRLAPEFEHSITIMHSEICILLKHFFWLWWYLENCFCSVYTVPYCCQSDVRPPATHTCLIWVVIPGVVHDHWVTLLVEHYLGDTAMLLRTESIAKHQHGSYCQFISDHIGALKISSKSFEMPKTQWSVEFNLLFLIIFQLLFVCLQLKSR